MCPRAVHDKKPLNSNREILTKKVEEILSLYLSLIEPKTCTQILKEIALVGKLMGLWPNLQAILNWAREVLKPPINNEVSIFVLGNGFFLTLFANFEDRDYVFKSGPSFMGSKGLFLAPWTLDFNPTREISKVLVWVRLPHFPFVLWDNEILKLIGDKLGRYIEHAEIKEGILSCARI